MKNVKNSVYLLLCLIVSVCADGLLISNEYDYPKKFLRNRLTHVEVNIHGLVAETSVYQEFINEWDQKTDAVYSFPLPPNARATQFFYWQGDKIYRAVLKVREQATNPGTGEGGIIAEVNQYIGRNGIKVALKDIPPGKIQKVKLYYVNHCDYYAGQTTYQFPLKTGDFVTFPLDHLQFTINVEANSEIISYHIPGYSGYYSLQDNPKRLHVDIKSPKAYINKDFEFIFTTKQEQMGVDFYSVANDTMDGHFLLYVRPQNSVSREVVFPKRIIFIVSTSSNMSGYKLDQCVKAINYALDMLEDRDVFNIITYNNTTLPWKSAPRNATPDNIAAAKSFLTNLSTHWGSRMDLGISTALNQITDEAYSNSVLIFTDGRSPLDPKEIESQNKHKAGLFPVGIGDDLDRLRLEMLAALNYGFVTYFDNDSDIKEGVIRLVQQIHQPILKDVVMEFGRADLHDLMPAKYPTTYAGSYFFIAGRYSNAMQSALAMAGKSVTGTSTFDFKLDFTTATNINKFTEHVWAKEKIDQLEREIEIYGETEELKQECIRLSLLYNIRCRYTAYVADYETEYTRVWQNENSQAVGPCSYLLNNYPNPFNPSTTLRVYIAPGSEHLTKLIRIYNFLGQLVAVIDITQLPSGNHSIVFDGRDFQGNMLPSGQYIVRLSVGDDISTLVISLIK